MRNFNCLALYINMDHETARNDSIRRALEMAGLPYDHDWIRIANGCCNATSSYIIRRDYIKVLKSSWEQSLPQFIDTIETIKRNKNASEGQRKQTRPLWWYNTDCHPWADLQARDGWFVLYKYITYQNRGRFPSYNNMTTETFRREHQ